MWCKISAVPLKQYFAFWGLILMTRGEIINMPKAAHLH